MEKNKLFLISTNELLHELMNRYQHAQKMSTTNNDIVNAVKELIETIKELVEFAEEVELAKEIDAVKTHI